MARFLRPCLLAAVALAAFLLLGPVSQARADAPLATFDWYRYQGASDSGPKASINCEVTSVAMSIQYARSNLVVPISSIRQYLGKDDLTTSGDAERALTNWGVPYRPVNSVQEIMAALDRGHIIMVGLMMNRISPGADYQKGSSAPALRFGRYNPYEGPHSVVVKAVTEDKGWFVVYDPNVWEGNPVYWYSDGTPKGKDRYYPVSEVAKAMADLGDSPKGLEVMAAPAQEAAVRPGVQVASAAAQGVASSAQPLVEFPRQSGDLAALGSSNSSWKSVTFLFRMFNPRPQALPVAQVAVQGRSPSGKEFAALSSPITLPPRSEGFLAIPMAVGDPGPWKVHRVLYYAEGAWRELPAGSLRQQVELVVR